jgi:hypothetical protein
MPLPINPIFPSPRSVTALLRGSPRANTPASVSASPIIGALQSRAIKIESWTDLIPFFGSEAGTGLDVLPWLIAHTYPAATCSFRPDEAWSSLFLKVVGNPRSERTHLRLRNAGQTQLIVAAALEFGQSFPAQTFICPLQSAAHIFSLCILPLGHGLKFLSTPQVCEVRDWLLDALVKAKHPYGYAEAEAEAMPTRRWNFLMGELVDRPASDDLFSSESIKPTRQELSKALDNLTAAWLTIGARLGPGLIKTMDGALDFSARLAAWPTVVAAIKRTDTSRVSFFSGAADPQNTADLLLACSSIEILGSLASPDSHISYQSWTSWFSRSVDDGSDLGDIVTVLRQPVSTSGYSFLFKRLAQEFGCRPLTGGGGKTLSHVLMDAHPTQSSVQIILENLGPLAFTISDDKGMTSLEMLANQSRSPQKDDWPILVAKMEHMVLQAAQDLPSEDVLQNSSLPDACSASSRVRRI